MPSVMPSGNDSLPAGWLPFEDWSINPIPPTLTWPEVMADVSYVWLLYNDPRGFYIIANWKLGADNVRISRLTGNAFEDVGSGLPGTNGEPLLEADSLLVEGADVEVTLSGALGDTPAFLIVGFSALNAPLHGGTLVPDPNPPGLIIPLVLGPSGTITLGADWPAGIPSDLQLWLQFWVEDPGAPFGYAASNAVRGTTP